MKSLGLLTDEHKSWIGHADTPVTVEISQRDIIKYSVATEQTEEKFLSGKEAPLMFIFNIFAEPRLVKDLRPDGLPRGNSNGPKLPLKRVMAGGTKVRNFRAIYPGDVLTGVNRIQDLYEKPGSKGPLIFTVRELEVTNQDGLPVFTETQTSIAR